MWNGVKIYAIDPGRVNGYAYYNTETGEFRQWEDADVPGGIDADVIVCESYVETDNNYTQQTDAQAVIGLIGKLCKANSIELFMQKPADAKRFATDDKLKILGWYKRTKDGHANDAAKHILTYLVKKKLLRAEERMTLKNGLFKEQP